MSVADELTALSTNIGSAYDAIGLKGGTIPANKNTENLATAIGTISGGATKDYGTITFAGYTPSIELNVQTQKTTTATVVDIDKFVNWAKEKEGNVLVYADNLSQYFQTPPDYTLQLFHSSSLSGDWTVKTSSSYGSIYFTTQEVEDLLGIRINLDPTDTSCNVYIGLTITLTNQTTTKHLDEVFDYYSLGTLHYHAGEDTDVVYDTLFDFHRVNHFKKELIGFEFGPDADFIPDDFLDNATSLNQPLVIPDGITEIPDGFLNDCSSFNSSITIPSSVTKIGDDFLYGCSSFNQVLDLQNITEIGDNFGYLWPYTRQLSIPNVKKIGSDFLRYAESPAFTLPIDFSNIEEIGNYFLRNSDYNNAIDLSSCSKIGNNFLWQNKTFNSNITLNQSGVDIGTTFLYGAEAFNKPLQAEYIKTLGNTAFSGCKAFNQPLNFSQLKTLTSSFLQNCIAFNSLVEFPILERVEQSAFNGCSAYNQPLTIPATVTYINFGQFMYNANNYTNTITVKTTTAPTSGGTSVISTNTQSAPMYQTGVTIKGAGRTTWLNRLPNRTSNPYRKLIDGGA